MNRFVGIFKRNLEYRTALLPKEKIVIENVTNNYDDL